MLSTRNALRLAVTLIFMQGCAQTCSRATTRDLSEVEWMPISPSPGINWEIALAGFGNQKEAWDVCGWRYAPPARTSDGWVVKLLEERYSTLKVETDKIEDSSQKLQKMQELNESDLASALKNGFWHSAGGNRPGTDRPWLFLQNENEDDQTQKAAIVCMNSTAQQR